MSNIILPDEPILLRILRKFKVFYVKNGFKKEFIESNINDIRNGNDIIRQLLASELISSNKKGIMCSKMGTVELENYCSLQSLLALQAGKKSILLKDFFYACINLKNYDIRKCFPKLISNAGFFPENIELGMAWSELVSQDLAEIDCFVSYQRLENYIKNERKNCFKVNFFSLLAPFLTDNPWSSLLEGKNVLVIHPFTETIKLQYETCREKIFSDTNVLPEFRNLYLIKAVQSSAGAQTSYETWFDALRYMEKEIDKFPDFDVALIGCGAYGMHLAAYCKRKGKIGLHLASYVQLLFGIYGKRWLEDARISPFINEYWVRPNENEKPKNFWNIEDGCYW